MTPTNNILAALQADYPDLLFVTADKASTGHVDDPDFADELIGVLSDDTLIVDPYTSSCGRFDAQPEVDHGIPEALAKRLLAHNLAPAPTSSEPNA